MLGQCCRREFLRHHQARAHRHALVADADRTPTSCLRIHRRLVQHPTAALDARLPQPRSIRSCPPQRRPSGGIINTSNLSVEPDQAHLVVPKPKTDSDSWVGVAPLSYSARTDSAARPQTSTIVPLGASGPSTPAVDPLSVATCPAEVQG